jgi:Polyketide cyclase / dehydrase and lipid transport
MSQIQIEHRILVAAQPLAIFQIYEDVDNWHTWDPDTKQARLVGPLRIGAKGTLTPTKGNTIPMLITEVVSGRMFTVEFKIPLLRMLFEHELRSIGSRTEVVHRVTISGLLSVFLGGMLSKRLNAGLPVTLDRLKRLAESKSQT